MKMKKIMVLLISVAMITSFTACGANKATPKDETPDVATQGEKTEQTNAPVTDDSLTSLKPVTLVVYSPGNESSVPTKTIIKYKELVETISKGQITLDVHHSNELGNDEEALQSTRMGTIDIVFAGTSGFTAFYDEAKILDLPFLFDSASEANEVVNSEIGEEIFENMPSVGLVYLAEGDNGMRNISTTNRPIHTAADLKGLKLRVPTSQMYLDVWEALGATPVALALPELTIALSNGTAEGQDNATYHLVANATYDDIKYYSNINYMWMGCTMAANAVSWADLPEEYQVILKEQAKIATQYSFDTIAADNKTATKTLQDAGVEFDTAPDINSFKEALGGSDYYLKYSEETWYNQGIIDAILAH